MAIELILASASPRRLSLLKQVGYVPDKVVPADIDESVLKGETPVLYVQRISKEKALKISTQHPNAAVLSGDTTVAVGRRILGKPENAEQAAKFLKLLSGRNHSVITSVTLAFQGKLVNKTVTTKVKFKNLTNTEIEFHTKSLEWEDKSGGYMIQGIASSFIIQIIGSSSNVVGLPLYETSNLLKSIGLFPKLLK